MARRSLPAAALVLCAVVALSARTPLLHESRPPVPEAASRFVADLLAYLTLAAVLAGAAVIAWALWPRDAEPGFQAPRRPWWHALAQVAVFAAAVAALAGLRAAGGHRVLPVTPAGPAGVPGAGALAGSGGDATAAGVDLVAAAFAGLVVLAVALLVWRRLRSAAAARRRRSALAREVAEAFGGEIDALDAGGDPRRAVILAYARLERVFAAHGLPRSRSETAAEFVERSLEKAGAAGASVSALGALYEVAHFSARPVDAAMRDAAVSALREAREGVAATAAGA